MTLTFYMLVFLMNLRGSNKLTIS